MNCEFQKLDDVFRCQRCGFEHRSKGAFYRMCDFKTDEEKLIERETIERLLKEIRDGKLPFNQSQTEPAKPTNEIPTDWKPCCGEHKEY